MTDKIKSPPADAASKIALQFESAELADVEMRYRADYITKVLAFLGAPVTVINVLLVSKLLDENDIEASERSDYPKQIIVGDKPVVVQSAADESAAKAPAPKPAATLPPKYVAPKEPVL